MKENINRILLVLCCGAVLLSHIKISSLEGEIRSLRNAISSVDSSVRNDIRSIYSNVDRMLEEQASLLLAEEYQIVSGDIREKTAALEIKIQPKEYTPGTTAAAVTVNGEEYPLSLSEGVFAAVISVPMMDETIIDKVSFTENGTVRSQRISWSCVPRYDYLTTVYGDLSASSARATRSGEIMNLELDSTLHITAERRGTAAKIEKVELVQVTDGREVWRKQMEYNNVDERHGTKEQAVTYHSRAMYDDNWTGDEFVCPVDMTFELPFGSTTYLLACVTDGDGLVHHCLAEMWQVSRDGRDWDDSFGWYHGMEAGKVFNPDGTLLYRLDYDEELYK